MSEVSNLSMKRWKSVKDIHLLHFFQQSNSQVLILIPRCAHYFAMHYSILGTASLAIKMKNGDESVWVYIRSHLQPHILTWDKTCSLTFDLQPYMTCNKQYIKLMNTSCSFHNCITFIHWSNYYTYNWFVTSFFLLS